MQLNPNESEFTVRIDIRNDTFVDAVVSIDDIRDVIFGRMTPVTQINATMPNLQPDSKYELVLYAIVDLELDTMRESVAEIRTLSELHQKFM